MTPLLSCAAIFASLVIAAPLLALPTQTVRPVAPPDTAPAAYQQSSPDVATNGRGFVAVWSDGRMAERPAYGAHGSAYATRLDEHGWALDPFGIELAPDAHSARIASNGHGYVAAFTTGETHAVRLGDDGRRIASPVQISPGILVDLTSNGATYCAVTTDASRYSAIVFGDDLTILRAIALDGWPTSVVATDDGAYMAFSIRSSCATSPCESRILATTIASDGTFSERTIAVVPYQWALARAVSNGKRILVSWLAESQSQRVIEFVVLRSDGTQVGTVRRVSDTGSVINGSNPGPSPAWDGQSFLLIWPDQTDFVDGVPKAKRISDEGEPLDAEPLALDTTAVTFASAWSGSRAMLVSSEKASEQLDVVSRVMTSFASLPELPPASIIAFSPTTQSEPDLATSGNVAVAVAREGDSYGRIGATLFAPRVSGGERHVVLAQEAPYMLQDGPSVGAAGDVFLAAWRERGDGGTRILARRIAANGALLDASPIVVDVDAVSYAAFADTSVASDGRSFLILWHGASDEVRARLVRRDGTLVGNAITVSRHPLHEVRERRTPAAIWTGTTYLVVWNELIVPEGNVSAENPTRVLYRAARVTRDATLLDTDQSLELFELVGAGQGLALARGGSRVLLATATGSYIGTPWSVHVFPLDLDGNPTQSAPLQIDDQIAQRHRLQPALAWDGRSFLLFWSDRGNDDARILGAQLDPHGTLVARFDVSDTSYFPAAVTIDGGTLLVHTAITTEQANVARLFARTFEPHIPRRRSVR